MAVALAWLCEQVNADTFYPATVADLVAQWNASTSAATTIMLISSSYNFTAPLTVTSGRSVRLCHGFAVTRHCTGRTEMELTLRRKVTVIGLNVNHTGVPVILSGQNISRIFQVMPKSSLTLQDLVLVDGAGIAPNFSAASMPTGPLPTDLGGGCVAAYKSSNTFDASSFSAVRTTFARCSSPGARGGAIYAVMPDASSFSLVNCTFVNNSADWGGAVSLEVDGGNALSSFVVSGSAFSKNYATAYGGGVYIGQGAYGASPIYRSSFTGNWANDEGGAILYGDTFFPLQLFQCSFSSNDAGDAGYAVSLQATSSVVEFDNSTQFLNNHGINGALNSTSNVVYAYDFASQVFTVALPTPAPTPAPTPPTTASPWAPVVPPSAPTPQPQSSSDVGLIAAVATGVTAIVLSAAAFASWIVYGRRNQQTRTQEAIAQQQQHIAFMRNRARAAQRPLIVHIGRQLRPDEAHEDCLVCQMETAPSQIVAKAMLTLSAVGANLTTPQQLATTFVRLSCDHGFHAACIIEWCEVYENETCPICRTIVAIRKAQGHSSTDEGSSQSNRMSWRRARAAQPSSSQLSGGGSMRRTMSANEAVVGSSRGSVLRASGGGGTGRNSVLRASAGSVTVSAADAHQLVPLNSPVEDHDLV